MHKILLFLILAFALRSEGFSSPLSQQDLARRMIGLAPEELVSPPTPRAPKKYPKTPPPPPEVGPKDRILINIPSRRLRYYRNGKLFMDVPMAIGRRKYPGLTGNSRTRIGSYKITSWHQNYRSRAYPTAWNVDPWRGAFGAYTAKLGPRASYQYIHGTVGPMSLGDWMVEKRDLPPLGEGDVETARAARSRSTERGLSHGCVRLSNRNVQKLWKLAPLQTTVEKFYCLVEKVTLGNGETTRVTHPNVYRYKDIAEEAVFDVAQGRLLRYRHPKDAIGPR